jgi:hypothetical protein
MEARITAAALAVIVSSRSRSAQRGQRPLAGSRLSGPIDSPISVNVPQAATLSLTSERERESAVNVIAPVALSIPLTVSPPFADTMPSANSAVPLILRGAAASPVIVKPELFLNNPYSCLA